jgi:hypothetical protein
MDTENYTREGKELPLTSPANPEAMSPENP